MREWFWKRGQRLGEVRIALGFGAFACFALAGAGAQAWPSGTPESLLAGQTASAPGSGSASAKKKKQAPHPADKDVVKPSISIPVTPLGFSPPNPFYFGERFAMVSLNFLDEDSLLFTFRVPGLIAREPAAPGQTNLAERHIRAVTLALPSGKVNAEGIWVLHDYSRYLWMMQAKKFMLRDRNLLQIGDASLHLEPFLRFPGPVNAVQFDPGQHLLITDTTEPPAPQPAGGTAAAGPAAQQEAGNPSTAAARMVVRGGQDADGEAPEAQRLVRILRMDTRQVMLFSHAAGNVHLPVDGDGYYDTLRSGDSRWLVAFEFFKGAATPIGMVDSVCDPNLDAMAPGIVLVSACLPNGARHLTALDRGRIRDGDKDHTRLWDVTLPPTKVWPQWASSGDGLRFARSTLEVSHPIGLYSPLNDSDVRGQSVQVYDLATGAVQLTVPVSPVLDGGGNFALSPSGRRLAILNDGAIQVFDLPPVPAIPTAPPAAPAAPKAPAKP
jgi:hypothetical protein